jgi:hypothetical protein
MNLVVKIAFALFIVALFGSECKRPTHPGNGTVH